MLIFRHFKKKAYKAKNSNRNGIEKFPDDVKLITKKLADIGYDCGLVGKLHLASTYMKMEKRTDDGYKIFHYSPGPHAPNGNIGKNKGNDYVDWLVEKGIDLNDVFQKSEHWGRTEILRGYKEDVPSELHQTTWCANKSIDFINENRDCPWLLNVNFFDPHPPFDAPKVYKESFDPDLLPEPLFKPTDIDLQKQLKDAFHQTKTPKPPDQKSKEMIASYYGMIQLLDEQVGRIIDSLEETNQRNNTVIIFNSDHGEMLGDHGLELKGCRFYEGTVRVPLIISWPENFLKNKIWPEIVELTDIVPTLAEITGLNLERTHGKSLIPILTENDYNGTHRNFVRCEYYDALHTAMPFNLKKHKPTYATMFYNGKYKLVVYHGLEIGELYDLEIDPYEFNNLWNKPEANDIKNKLIKKSFDESIKIVDPGPPQIGPW